MSVTDHRPAVVADTGGMERADWLEARRNGIGGSDAAAICGQDRWRSAFEVWLDKTGVLPPDDEMSEPAEWGVLLEPIVRDQVAKRTGLTIEHTPVLLAHPDLEWMLANTDGTAHDPITGTSGVYEGKTAGVWSADEWKDDKVPDAYVLQGAHYLAVTGLDWCVFGVLIGGQRLAVRVMRRDQELIDHLIRIEADFWSMVESRIPPPADGSKACTELLGHLYDVKPGSVLAVDPAEVMPLLEERAEAKAAVKAAEYRCAEVENQLKLIAGEHEVVADGHGTPLFTWREQTRKSYVAKAATFRKLHVPKGVLG